MRRSSTAVSSSLVIFPFVKASRASFNSAGRRKEPTISKWNGANCLDIYNPPYINGKTDKFDRFIITKDEHI